MSVPDRYAAKVERLGEIANRNDGTDLGDIALELASFVTESTHTEHAATAPGPLGERIDRLALEVDARFVTHELAITELYRRIGPDPTPKADATLFKIPVAFAEGQDADSIRAAVSALDPGLSGDDVVARLEADGLVRRVGDPPANHTDVTVTPARQGGHMEAETDK